MFVGYSLPTSHGRYQIDFVCNPEKRDQIIADVEKRKSKLLEDAGLCRIED